MSEYYQIVQVQVRPGVEEAMLEQRPRFVSAMKQAVPGLMEARLVKLEDGTWLDIVRWQSRADAETGAVAHHNVPEAAEMGRFLSEVIGIQQGEAAHPTL